jgi:thiol:disulfide interchange protein DsbD
MPCVLPVISLKILSFVRQAKEDRARVFLLGVAYCAGIMVFFSFLAILFAAKGEGWGQLFQKPHVVLGLAAVVTAFAMSLFGVFAVFTPKVINELGQKAEEREGLPSAFFTGVLATFLGTACTAPFLSAAVGAATRYPGAQGAMIFVVVGAGMAFPFLILAAKPGWLKFVPRPGPWMETFERLMGFLLLGTVVWLLNPLRGQLGAYGLLLSLIFLLGVAVAVWIKGKVQFGDALGRKARLHLLALLILVMGWVLPFRIMSTIPELMDRQIETHELLAMGELAREDALGSATGLRNLVWPKEGLPWQHYMRSRMLQDVRRGHTVFVDYTADWCVNCKFNKKTSIEQQDVIALMKEYNVIPYEADYTLPVPEIKEDLDHFKKAGVPLYLVYKPGDTENPIVLPEVLTPAVVINALKEAGPSRPLATKAG